ncbi:hypothetical protein, conserved [Babesia bigemina]|uniref:C3H1-type domain-containing protein n=1 Tax=Babesia bigemina TaxID=5866 RepID=A0A061BTS1_BABBI|nr:hypothetical protein, conserved [Babesia bigemina]CDR71879.1 hypothetical protein, conserved [Babesia bigemina]|eukprot:XP_012770822.1 hypothetical protein, conserved [Babesia bigemina]
MGFLSGVLGAVKGDEAVKTYINADETNIIIRNLKNSIGKGSAALSAQIGEVSKWLQRYELAVGSKTGAVITKLGELIDKFKSGAGEYYKEVASRSGDDLKKQLAEWTRVVGHVTEELKQIETNHVNELDNTLKRDIMHELTVAKASVHMLGESAANSFLKGQAKQVDETLETEKNKLDNQITKESKRVQETLMDEFRKIRDVVTSLNEKKREHFERAHRHLLEVSKFMDEQFDSEYMTKILGKFTDIKWEVGNIYDTLKKKKGELEHMVKYARTKFEELRKHSVKVVSGGSNGSVEHFFEQLKEAITSFVNKLTAEEKKSDDASLQAIVDGVKAYARGFGTGTLETTVQEWVKEIVQTDENVVSSNVSTYVSRNRSSGTLSTIAGWDRQEQAVKDAIIAQLPHFIKIDIENAVQQSLQSADVSTIHAKFNQLAEKILQEISNDGNPSIGVAVGKIGGHLGMTPSNVLAPLSDDKNLKSAVRAIYKSIANKFKQMAKEIGRFVQTSKIHPNLQKAIAEVKVIANHFKPDGLADSYGTMIDMALQKVKPSIKELDEVLDKRGTIGSIKGIINEIDEDLSKIYKLKQEQTDIDLDNDGEINKIRDAATIKAQELKGKIRIHIYDIREAVNTADGELEHAIRAVRKTVNYASDNCKIAVSHLQSQLISDVQTAFANVTMQVRQLFAEEHKSDLKALRTLVGRQLKTIRMIIEKDLQTGLKGLFKSMLKDDGKNVTTLQSKHGITALATKACTLLTKLVTYVESDLRKVDPKFTQLSKFGKSIELFTYDLIEHAHFSHPVSLRLSTLASLSSALDPQALPDAGRPVLRALKDGMLGFVGELEKGYVSRYDGGESIKEWVKRDGEKDVLTPEGKNGAKVFLTLLNTLCEDLPYLENKCKENSKYSWKHKTISEKHDNKENALGCYLKRCGYAVAKDEHSKDGELNFPYRNYMGGHIYQKLNELKFVSGNSIFQHLLHCDSNVNERSEKIKTNDFTIFELLKCLLHHVDEYNEVCHYATTFSRKQPCTVYEMLAWCSGLTYNPVYHGLQLNGFTSFLDKPKSKGTITNKHEDEEEEGPTVEDSTALGLDAYPSDITFNSVSHAVAHITSKCHDILTTIVGTGDAETVYACDYSNNYLALSYPADPAQCFETLIDILRRMLPQLRFLLTKCSTKTEHNGWRNCEYGKLVPTSKSHCNEQPSDKVTSKATCQPTCQANTKVNCQPTSPLMSYLNDCLPGHLPHHVTSIGCKSVCSNCPRNKPGQPCLTPLGFRGFSCSTRTGKKLYEILVTFLGDVELSRLMCLLPKPPATLPEHFGFALSLVNGWNNPSKYKTNTLKNDVESSISSVSMQLYLNPDNFSKTICNAYSSRHTNTMDKNHLPAYADLSSLAIPTVCTAADVKCAPYLFSLSCDLYYHLAKKHSGLYLSWAIYLPWTFWDLLNNLYNSFCSINCQDWGCRGCLRDDKCKKGEHGVIEDEKKPNPTCPCPSIVDCKGVAPTLYQYGFVFGEASTLNDKASPKKCSDFCSQLKNVLNSQYFKKLFEECDNFLWRIREPFSYLVLSLWLLSFLYLIHIMVIRLDLLHIKSHLHSPSSHRIAAQSLLAAARVNKLNRVFYLQP